MQICFITTTNEKEIQELLTKVSHWLHDPTYEFDRGDFVILDDLNELDASSDERLYNKFFNFYKKSRHEIKFKIENYSREINAYVATKKLLEKKLGLLIKKELPTESLDKEKESFEKIRVNLVKNVNDFFKKLSENETVVAHRLKYLHLNKEKREEYDKK